MPAQEGISRHATGNFAAARVVREAEFYAMEPDDPRRPGAAGTLALTCERQGDEPQALYFADQAINTATPVNEPDKNLQVRAAEWTSTRINAGTVFFRAGTRARLRAEYPAAGTRDTLYGDQLLAGAWESLREERTGIRPHQHAINLIARVAMTEAVNDNPKGAFKHSLGAIALAPLSESPWLATHTSGFGIKGKAISKAKDTARGVTAVAIATTSLPGIRRWPAVRRIRDKMILAPWM